MCSCRCPWGAVSHHEESGPTTRENHAFYKISQKAIAKMNFFHASHLNSPFTVRKRSLGQGNVFTRVPHSVHRGHGSRSLSQGVSVPRGICVQKFSVQGALCQGYPRTVKSRRYASYWNAFFFIIFLQKYEI